MTKEKNAIIKSLGLEHRNKHRPVDVVPVRFTGSKSIGRALYDRTEKWKEKNCDAEMTRAIDEIELGWKLDSCGGPTAKQFPYEEIGSRATNTDPQELSAILLEIKNFVRKFEFRMKRMHPMAWKSFELRFRDGMTFHKADKGQRKGLAAQHCVLILKMYVRERGWYKHQTQSGLPRLRKDVQNHVLKVPDYKATVKVVDERGRIEA